MFVIGYFIFKEYRREKLIRLKEEELLNVKLKKAGMEVDEEIVEAEIDLKKRTDKLNKQKEKLDV